MDRLIHQLLVLDVNLVLDLLKLLLILRLLFYQFHLLLGVAVERRSLTVIFLTLRCNRLHLGRAYVVGIDERVSTRAWRHPLTIELYIHYLHLLLLVLENRFVRTLSLIRRGNHRLNILLSLKLKLLVDSRL